MTRMPRRTTHLDRGRDGGTIAGMSTVSEEVARETFQYRRVSAELYNAPAMLIQVALMTVNATPWKCHPPRTIHIRSINWKQQEDGTGELVTTFAFGNPGCTVYGPDMGFVRRYDFCKAVDFNEFNFGELWEPDA